MILSKPVSTLCKATARKRTAYANINANTNAKQRQKTTQINCSELLAGCYLVHLTTEGGKQFTKVIGEQLELFKKHKVTGGSLGRFLNKKELFIRVDSIGNYKKKFK